MSELPQGWTTVALADVIEPAGRKAEETTDFPVYSVTKHSGFVPSEEYFNKQVYSRDLSNYKLVRAGDFAYATIHLDEGSIGIASEDALISPMYTAFTVDESRVDPHYLLRFMKSPQALAQYELLGSGSVHRRRSISLKRVGELKVPLPPLPEQRRIAAILDNASHLEDTTSDALEAATRHLPTALFRHHFRDSPTRPLGDVADMFGGASLPAGEPFTGQEGGHFLVKVSDMNLPGNESQIRAAQLWSSAQGAKASTAPAQSIVLPKRGGAIGTNKKRILARPALLDPNLMGISARPDALMPEVLYHWFLTFNLSSITSGSTVPQLNKKDLAPLQVPCPPLEEQHEFANHVRAVGGLTESAAQRAQAMRGLSQSLQSRAFRGEL